jgi:hypothetical protein
VIKNSRLKRQNSQINKQVKVYNNHSQFHSLDQLNEKLRKVSGFLLYKHILNPQLIKLLLCSPKTPSSQTVFMSSRLVSTGF